MLIYILMLAIGFLACTAAWIVQGQKPIKGYIWIPIIITFFIPIFNCIITPYIIIQATDEDS